MLKCVDCGYKAVEFDAQISSIVNGAFTYVAKCPNCGSLHVNHITGYHAKDLKIGVSCWSSKPQK